MKKVVSLMLALALILSIFAGCAAGDEPKTKETENTTKTAETLVEEETTLIAKEPLELSIFEFGLVPFNNDYKVFNKITEITNISLKSVISESSSDSKQAFNLMMASDDIADIVAWIKDDIYKLALDGAFIPLNDLIAEHAPNLQKFLDENPDIKRHATYTNGNIYFIPYIPDGDASEGWFIRQDWLDLLGLEQPKNIDELYTVLKAFREQDPNGNEKKDEVPFFRRKNVPNAALADLALLWGAEEGWFVKDGVVKYGPMEPEYKTAYENLAKWYAEGLIDQEIYTRGKTARDVLLGDNLGGMTHDWFGSTSTYNDRSKIKDFKFIAFAPPANVNGKVVERVKRSRIHNQGWAISASNKYPVETIKYFDYFFTEEGRRLSNFGIEGETYTMVDGEAILTDMVLNNESGALAKLREYGAQIAIGVQQDFNYEKQQLNKIAVAGVSEYMNNGYFREQFPISLPYTEIETKRFAEIMVAINTLRDETSQKWVLGAEDVASNYDSYRKALISFNIEEAIAIQQAAYDRYMGE